MAIVNISCITVIIINFVVGSFTPSIVTCTCRLLIKVVLSVCFIYILYTVEQQPLYLGVLPPAAGISAVPLVSSQTPQVSFSPLTLLMSSSVAVPMVSTVASHLPISTAPVLGHPSPLSSLLPASSLASIPPTLGSLNLSLSSETIPVKLLHRI